MPTNSRAALRGAPLILGAMAVCVALGYGIVVPVLPTFAASFGVGAFASSAVVSVFALARLAMSPFAPRLDRRFGERGIVVSGLLIVALSSAAAGMAQTYLALLVLRGLGGIGSAMFSISSMSLLLGSVGPELRGRATALYHGGFLIGGVAGPAAGGLLGGFSHRAPFFVYAGTLLLAAAVASRLPSIQSADAGPNPPPDRSVGELLRDVRFQAACFSGWAQGWNSVGVRAALIPLFVAATMYPDPRQAARWTGVLMALAAGVQALALYPAGAVADKVGRRAPMVAGAALAAVSIGVAPFTRSPIWLGVIMAVYALASAISGTVPAAVVGDVAGKQRGRGVAIFSMSTDIGAIVGPLVGGLLVDSTSFAVAFGVGAAIWAASAGLSSRIPSTRRRYP